ncbi:MAG TPA: DUF992 domain-containing protein [Xanthobacteraceae bacterium]|nr:DUF992 domain-containing protein [Xanthobacteraceae bacterium]
MRRFSLVLGLAAAAVAGSAIGASAQQALRPVGVLECQGGPSVGLIVGSESALRCVLRQPGRRAQTYAAKVRRVGVDVGVTEKWVLGWNVYSTQGRIRPGGLAGSYDGAGSSLTIGVGAGSNIMNGGPGNTVSLQPLPMRGQTGLNFAVGFQGMDIIPLSRRGR